MPVAADKQDFIALGEGQAGGIGLSHDVVVLPMVVADARLGGRALLGAADQNPRTQADEHPELDRGGLVARQDARQRVRGSPVSGSATSAATGAAMTPGR